MIGKFVAISFLGAIAAADWRGPALDYYYDEDRDCSDLWAKMVSYTVVERCGVEENWYKADSRYMHGDDTWQYKYAMEDGTIAEDIDAYGNWCCLPEDREPGGTC